MRSLWTAGLLLLCAPSASLRAEPLTLVEGGCASANIVLGTHPSEVERFAAEELQRYISLVTAHDAASGARLPILGWQQRQAGTACEILIGRPATHPEVAELCAEQHLALDEAALGGDGYLIRTLQSSDGRTTLLLTGSHERSCLFAVYHLLETLGVRFFGYQARNGEVVPRLNPLNLPPLDIIEKPTMSYRFVSDNNFNASDKTKLTHIADWAAKNRCNAFMLTPSRPGETWNQIALDEVRKRGLMVVGPGHVLARFTPDKAMFATHPEYFPLLKGRRDPVISDVWGGSTAFCWSNREAMRLTVERAVHYLKDSPPLDVFAVYPPDGSQRGVQCQCEHCAGLSMSDWYLTLMNEIASAASTLLSRQKYMWIAYNECGVPPAHVRPWQNGKNFVLLWCNDIRDFTAPMDSEINRHAALYLEGKPRLKTIKTNGLKNPSDMDLAAWHRWQGWSSYLKSSGYAGDIVVLDYYNAHVGKSLHVPLLTYCQSGPWPDGVMSKDFQFYTAQGISGWQNCTDYYNDEPTSYWNWLGAQLMWNSQADLRKLDENFYDHLYGPAGGLMHSYFSSLWHEMALPGGASFDALGNDLSAAEKLALAARRPDIAEKIKAVGVFHQRCVRINEAQRSNP